MDKRYNVLPLPDQLMLRKRAIEEVLANPQWALPHAIRHLKKTMRLTTAELAKLAGVSYRTLQNIELGQSEGTVQTMNQILGVVGLKLGVVSAEQAPREFVAVRKGLEVRELRGLGLIDPTYDYKRLRDGGDAG